jgi:EAL domain-containing protein (putative c-di-GMP-specific phosphodiesterase class I)
MAPVRRRDCLLDRLLLPGALRAEFQPVYQVAGMVSPVHYLEGLLRGPRGTNAERPEVLFSYARRKHAEIALDRAAVRTVLLAARAIRHTSVGVNVHAATLASDLDFLPFLGEALSESGMAAERLVLELVEHGHVWDRQALRLNLEGLRQIGVRMALDDFGTGEANYLMFVECRPDYLKIDRYFVHGCHVDPRRQAVLDSLAGLACCVGARVVAEGVENAADLARVRAAGIELAQGFLLGRPEPAACWPSPGPGGA